MQFSTKFDAVQQVGVVKRHLFAVYLLKSAKATV